MQIPLVAHDINVRSASFFIAHTHGICRHCCARTPLVGLAVPPGHETLELDYDVPAEELASDTWRTAVDSAFLFHVEFLAAGVQRRLVPFAGSFRFVLNDTDAYWANHCMRCAAPLDDGDLFCEPGAPFLPTSESGAAAITLSAVDEPFEGNASGYAYEPAFFAAMKKT